MVAQGLGQQLSAGPGLGLAQLLSIDGADAAVHVASAAAAVSWVQEAARRRFTAAAFQGLATEGSTGSCPAGFGVAQDYRMYKVAGRARRAGLIGERVPAVPALGPGPDRPLRAARQRTLGGSSRHLELPLLAPPRRSTPSS
jgi:hypothetical protein